jgi:hypothetical protein
MNEVEKQFYKRNDFYEYGFLEEPPVENKVADIAARGLGWLNDMVDQNLNLSDMVNFVLKAINPQLQATNTDDAIPDVNIKIPQNFNVDFETIDTRTGEPREAGGLTIDTQEVTLKELLQAIPLSEIFGTAAAERVAEDVAYGESPDPIDVLETAAVGTGVALGGIKAGAKAVDTLGPTAAELARKGFEKTQGLATQYAVPPDQNVIKIKLPNREKPLRIEAGLAATMQRNAGFLTSTELAKFNRASAKTFVNTLKKLPTKQEFAAAAIGGEAKKGWYENSTKAILNVFGDDAPIFASLLAALSPQTSVESNLKNALNTFNNWVAAGRPSDRDEIIQVLARSVEGSKGVKSVLEAWVNNTVRALNENFTPETVLSGAKVNSFYLNLTGNVNEVTNDAWMSLFGKIDQDAFAGSLNKLETDPGKSPGYLAMNARTRAAAKYLTDLTGDLWTPAEVQETVWSWAKTLMDFSESAGQKLTPPEIVYNDILTNDLINSTPDFRTLFYEEGNARILEQAGYGEQVGKLRELALEDNRTAVDQKSPAGDQAEKSAVDPEKTKQLNLKNAQRLVTARKIRRKKKAEVEAKKAIEESEK